MLQHACFKLVNIAFNQSRSIAEKDVADVLYSLTNENSTISLLKTDLEKNQKLQNIVTFILKGVANPFSRNRGFSIAGAGCIIGDENKSCRIRNQVFKKAIEALLEDPIVIETLTSPIPGQDTEFPHLPTNKYSIIKKIGEGGMGIVYKARDKRLSRFVAVKVLKPELAQDRKIRERFYREAQITAQLQHPKILTVHEVRKSKYSHAIIMEFINGKSLKEQLARGTDFSYLHVFYIAKELLEALDHAHNHNERIIHRDIKPANIMINHRGELKVLDFGLAVIRDVCTDEKTSAVIGTLNYMSPEQSRGEMVDERSDIYSCGATMFNLATNILPFRTEMIDYPFLVNFMKKDVEKDIPDELSEIIAKCMAEKKEKRFQSARELLEKIKEVEMTLLKRFTTKDDIKDIIPTASSDEAINTVHLTQNRQEKNE
jgi:serine/threonine protein kinase